MPSSTQGPNNSFLLFVGLVGGVGGLVGIEDGVGGVGDCLLGFSKQYIAITAIIQMKGNAIIVICFKL